jgi:hypothetical protein
MDIYPPTVQRPALLKLAEILKSRDNALRRDECGDWTIFGKRGHIYAVPGGFQVFVMGWSAGGWTRAKAALTPFSQLTNDGDSEGAIIISRLPTFDEAEIIRHWVGIGKRRELSDEGLANLRQHGVQHQFKAKKSASEGGGATPA